MARSRGRPSLSGGVVCDAAAAKAAEEAAKAAKAAEEAAAKKVQR